MSPVAARRHRHYRHRPPPSQGRGWRVSPSPRPKRGGGPPPAPGSGAASGGGGPSIPHPQGGGGEDAGTRWGEETSRFETSRQRQLHGGGRFTAAGPWRRRRGPSGGGGPGVAAPRGSPLPSHGAEQHWRRWGVWRENVTRPDNSSRARARAGERGGLAPKRWLVLPLATPRLPITGGAKRNRCDSVCQGCAPPPIAGLTTTVS